MALSSGLGGIAGRPGGEAKQALLGCLARGEAERAGDARPAHTLLPRCLDQVAFGEVEIVAKGTQPGQLGEGLGGIHPMSLGVNEPLASFSGYHPLP